MVSVVDLKRSEPVYDLTVDGQPEFFANGLLVHNCFDGFRYAMSEIAPWQPRKAPEATRTVEQQADHEYRARLKVDEEAREREQRNRAAKKRAANASGWWGQR